VSTNNELKLSYSQRKKIKQLGAEFNIEKYPLLSLKAKELVYKENWKRKLFGMIAGISIIIVNRFSLAKKIRDIIYDDIHNALVNTYAEWPAEVYASILAVLVTLVFITMPIVFFAPFLYMVFPLLAVGFGVYLMQYAKIKSSGMSSELFDIISLWYVVSSSGMPIKEQIKTIYDILRTYKQINLKYGKLFPEYKMYNMFFEMYYDMEKRNYNEVTAFANQLPKIQDKRMKFIMSRLHRAVRDGFELSIILADEFRKAVEDEVKRIEAMGSIMELLTELYSLILMFYIGFMVIIDFTMASIGGIYALKMKLEPLIMQIPLLTIVSTAFLGVIINYLKGNNRLKKEIPYPSWYKILAIGDLILYIIMYLLIGRYSAFGFIITHLLPALIILYPMFKILNIRKNISSLDRELSIRFQQISSALKNGYMLSEAFDSAVTHTDPKKMDFNDVIYTYFASYLRIGYTMRDLLEKLIIRIPSEQFRGVLSIIALTEERASNLADFIERLSDAIEEKMKTIDLVNSKTQMVVVQVFIVAIANVLMLAYMLLMSVSPMPLIMKSLEGFGLVYMPENTNYPLVDMIVNFFAPLGETSQSNYGPYVDIAVGVTLYLSFISAVAIALFFMMYYDLTSVETIGLFLLMLMLQNMFIYHFMVRYVFDFNAYHQYLVSHKLIVNQTI